VNTEKTRPLFPRWARAKLGSVLPIKYGKGLTEESRDPGGSVNVYGSSGIVGRHSAAITAGPTLIIGRKGTVGSIYYSRAACWPTDTTYFVEATPSTNLLYFSYLLDYLGLGSLERSTAIPGLNRDDYSEVDAPIAPIHEQERIVAEMEKQFTRLDAATASLQQVRTKLDRYRASILKAACEGRLVPTEAELARVEKRDYEPADKLLERILANRRLKWEQHQIEKMRRDGVEPKNDRWRSKYKEPSTPLDVNSPSVPEGWTNVTLGQLAWSVRDGPHFSPTYIDDGVPFISGGNVRPNGVDFDGAKRITPELHREFSQRTKPEKGDILYTKGGTTGIARVNTYDIEFSVWVHVAVLKLASGVDPFFLQHTLNSPLPYAQAQKYTHGVGNQDLGLTRMVNITFGLPPLAEQKTIVEEIDRRMSMLDELDHLINASLLRGSRLRQAILNRAFRGSLVRQNPNDESASVLLDRIRAEREQAATQAMGEAKGKRGKRKTMAQDRRVQRKTIIEALTEAKMSLSPEKLFSATGHQPETIDEFYSELKAGVVCGQIEEVRTGDDGVLLRVKQA
jgi:type I restriction enzyme S subunit